MSTSATSSTAGTSRTARECDVRCVRSTGRMLERDAVGSGVYPDDVVTLLRYAPLGLTHLCWRNTVLEDWHAGPDSRISDHEMMRANVATTRLFHQALWAAFGERVGQADLISRADFTDDDVEALEVAFGDAGLWDAFSADRLLPHGPTLHELGGDEVIELYEHVATQLGALLEQAEARGVAVVLMWLAARGRASCADWWGSPRWPRIVDAFLARLASPDDGFWTRWAGRSSGRRWLTRRGYGTCC